MVKIRRNTAIALGLVVLSIGALAAWGEHLGMSRGALVWCQTAAGMIGATIMALAPALLHDGNGNGIPDVLEREDPPKGPPPSGPVSAAFAFAALALLSGCNGPTTPVQVQAHALDVAIVVVNVADTAIASAVTHDLHTACDASPDPDACAADVAAHWAPVRAVLSEVHLAIADWLIALRLAAQAGTDPLGAAMAAAAALLDSWGRLAADLKAFGVNLPDVPPEVKALIPATSGGAA